jgi:hypothetical protein
MNEKNERRRDEAGEGQELYGPKLWTARKKAIEWAASGQKELLPSELMPPASTRDLYHYAGQGYQNLHVC